MNLTQYNAMPDAEILNEHGIWDDTVLADQILSDCGISTNDERLRDKVAARIALHREGQANPTRSNKTNTPTQLLELALEALIASRDDVATAIHLVPSYKADLERRVAEATKQLDKHESTIKDIEAYLAKQQVEQAPASEDEIKNARAEGIAHAKEECAKEIDFYADRIRPSASRAAWAHGAAAIRNLEIK